MALFPTKNALKKTEGKGLEKAIGAYPNAQPINKGGSSPQSKLFLRNASKRLKIR